MKYAISAVRGHEADTFCATPLKSPFSIPRMYDTELGAPYEIAFIEEYESEEEAYEAAMRHYSVFIWCKERGL